MGIAGVSALLMLVSAAMAAGQENRDDALVRAGEAALADALNRGDFDTAMAAFAPDAVLYVEGVPPREGRAEVRRHLEDVHARGLLFRIATSRVILSGDLAVTYGTMGVSAPTAGGRTPEYPGKVMTVWRRIDGTWRVVARAPSSNGPRPPLS